MSPMTSEKVFIYATPDSARIAYLEEALAGTRNRGATEEYMDAREKGVRSVEILPGSDIMTELAKISSTLHSMEKDRQGTGQCGGGRVEPCDGLYGGGFGRCGRYHDLTLKWNLELVG